ncbi:MAG: TPR-like protein [Monoraphidium minutum]|nr:MAG: TPR-like protein [Monoraphidium minutum]
MAQADKKLKSFGFFGNKYEEAAELLEKAANNYKLGKAWKQAADAYRQLAGVHTKMDSKHDAASSYVEGAKALMKVAPGEAVVLLQQAVEVYTDMGRLQMAARQLKEIAEAQEKQGLKEEAITFYNQAADLFATENSSSEANKCRLKVAEFSAEVDRFADAAEIYEDVARAAADNNLLRFGARGHLLCAGVCVLCHANDEDVRARIERYKDIDLQFSGSREAILLEAVADALAQCDEKAFATAVAEFDSMTRLDAWKTNMLLKVKRRIQARASGEEPGAESEDEVL